MFKKRFLLALAVVGVSVGTTLQASKNGNSLLSFFNGPSVSTETAFVECSGGATESFSNIPASSSTYTTRTWTGDNGVAWSATDARTDQTLTGKAIALRTSTLKNTVAVPGGIGTLTFKYKRVFTGNSTLKVFVNGTQYGGDITVTSETAAVFTQAINVAGNVNVEIRNSLNRVIIDDVSWTCYQLPAAGPELQLADNANVNKECGALTLNYGTQSVDAYSDAVFTIKNTGTSALAISSLTLSDTVNFSIVSPVAPSFSVPASGSTIVLVRFDAATAGSKTATLTVASNDVSEASCVVNLTGTALAPCVAPVVTEGAVTISDITSSSADVAVTNAVANGYLAVVSTTGSLTALPSDAVTYTVGDSIGGGVVAYNGTLADFTLSGLSGATNYTVYVFPYNITDCIGGPLYNTTYSIKGGFTTPCLGASETFANMPANSSTYTTRTWTGDNGMAWTATDARTDQTLTGRAIALRTGSLTNTTPQAGGIGTLSFNYRRVFTGNSTLKVLVNGVQVGGDITVGSDTATVFTQDINVPGNITVEIENSGNRVVVDDVLWTCYEIPNRPEIQLADDEANVYNCGALNLNLGNVAINADNEFTFTIRNTGLQALEISDLVISDSINYSIVSPAIPASVNSLSNLVVTMRFNSATAGSKPAVLTILSNDADEASCTVTVEANVITNCVAPAATGVVSVSNETPSSFDVVVTGVTADGYLAVVSTDSTATAPVDGTGYSVNDTLGSGTIAYIGSSASFTVEGLDAGTTYSVFVYAYNGTNCLNGPLYSVAMEDEGSTTTAPCVGDTETFTNIGTAASSYATRTWTGDNGVEWTATDSRTDQTLNGKAITVRTGSVENTTAVPGGIGTLTFNYKRIFNGNSTLKVFVNGVQVGANITVSSDIATPFSQVVNVTGDVTVELENGGNRVIIDDISWNCYSASSARQAAPAAKTAQVNDAVKLFPNPNNGQFQLDMVTETADVVIYNTVGKQVLNRKVAKNEVIDLSGAEKGVYMVVITSGSTVSNKKVVIK